MVDTTGNGWNPHRFQRLDDASISGSTNPLRIMTDSGGACLKALGNPEGPHALAREWIGTKLAGWMGLRTFEISQIPIPEGLDLYFRTGRQVQPGPAIVTRWERGGHWSGDSAELRMVENIDDVSVLVALDTLIRNWDRFPPEDCRRQPAYRNVFLSEETGNDSTFALVAMDHTHCLACGSDLSPKISDIAFVKDRRIYGAFPAFHPYIGEERVRKAQDRLRQLNETVIRAILQEVPVEWSVDESTRSAIASFVVERAAYLAENLRTFLVACSTAQANLDL